MSRAATWTIPLVSWQLKHTSSSQTFWILKHNLLCVGVLPFPCIFEVPLCGFSNYSRTRFCNFSYFASLALESCKNHTQDESIYIGFHLHIQRSVYYTETCTYTSTKQGSWTVIKSSKATEPWKQGSLYKTNPRYMPKTKIMHLSCSTTRSSSELMQSRRNSIDNGWFRVHLLIRKKS
jgi:hypothetical protein